MNKKKIWDATAHLKATASEAGICRSQFLLAITLGLCCSAGLLLTANPTLNQAGLIDPYLYVGYTNDYAGLLERFGPTYYADRIAYIFPARAFNYLFGLEGGYFAFRFVALAAATASVFIIGLRFYGFTVALLGAVWLTFTPDCRVDCCGLMSTDLPSPICWSALHFLLFQSVDLSSVTLLRAQPLGLPSTVTYSCSQFAVCSVPAGFSSIGTSALPGSRAPSSCSRWDFLPPILLSR